MDLEETIKNSNSEKFSILSENFENSESSFEQQEKNGIKHKKNIFNHQKKSIIPQDSDLDLFNIDSENNSFAQENNISQMISFGIDKTKTKKIPKKSYDHSQFDRPYLPKIITKVNYEKQKMGIFSKGKLHPSLITESAETLEVRNNQSSQI